MRRRIRYLVAGALGWLGRRCTHASIRLSLSALVVQKCGAMPTNPLEPVRTPEQLERLHAIRPEPLKIVSPRPREVTSISDPRFSRKADPE